MGFKNSMYRKLRQTLFIDRIVDALDNEHQLQVENFLNINLFNNSRYQSPDKLNRFEFQVFSQNGEDGIIQEIFKRIGITSKFFVEFGVETGIETNSTYLLHQGWSGFWIEGDSQSVKSIESSFAKVIEQKQLRVFNRFINAENIERLFAEAEVPSEFDLLSIDIDRNDYYVWKAITNYAPRVVVIEYNAIFRPGCDYVINYDSNAVWDRSSNYGASLDALEKLGISKGYKLVACNFTGANAFFVRKDLVEGNFVGPFTSANHYEPPRYFLFSKPGHPRKVAL